MNEQQLIALKGMLENQKNLFCERYARDPCAKYKAKIDETLARLAAVQSKLDELHPPPKQVGKVIFITAEEREFEQYDRMMKTNGNDYAGKGL